MTMIFLCTHPPLATQVPGALVPPVLVRVGRRGRLACPAAQRQRTRGREKSSSIGRSRWAERKQVPPGGSYYSRLLIGYGLPRFAHSGHGKMGALYSAPNAFPAVG